MEKIMHLMVARRHRVKPSGPGGAGKPWWLEHNLCRRAFLIHAMSVLLLPGERWSIHYSNSLRPTNKLSRFCRIIKKAMEKESRVFRVEEHGPSDWSTGRAARWDERDSARSRLGEELR